MDETGNVHGAFRRVAATAIKSHIQQMAAESKAEFEEITAWMSKEQKSMLSAEMLRQRG